jgi:predicted CoA-binding protein
MTVDALAELRSEPESWRPPSAGERLRILNRTRTIAMVGASSNPARASNFVATYLLSSSTNYTIWFVNPREKSILGHPVYPSLSDLPEPPDLVDVFRRNDELPRVAADAIEAGARTFWAQLGLRNKEAADLAHAAGLAVVMDRCVKIEHARFAGGLHLAGFDTGVISSRRPARPGPPLRRHSS